MPAGHKGIACPIPLIQRHQHAVGSLSRTHARLTSSPVRPEALEGSAFGRGALPDLAPIGELRSHIYKALVHPRLCCGPSRVHLTVPKARGYRLGARGIKKGNFPFLPLYRRYWARNIFVLPRIGAHNLS